LFLLSLSTSITVYRVFFHPLRDIPGPLICKISQLWSAVSFYKGKHFLDEEGLYKAYDSPFVRIGPNEVLVVHQDAVVDILGGNSNLPKSRQYTGARGVALINIKDPDHHALRRREWAKGFTTDALKDYNTVFESRIAELMPLLKAKAKDGPVDLTKWIKAFACDVMGDLSGFQFKQMQDQGDEEGFWGRLEKAAKANAVYQIGLYFLVKLKGGRFSRKCSCMSARSFVNGFRGRRRKTFFISLQVFHASLLQLADQENLEFEKMLPVFTRDALLLMIAGADTTQGSLGCLFYFLLQSPDKYKVLQEAIDRLYAENGVPGSDPLPARVLASCAVLEAYINETLRLAPPLKSGQPREIPAGGRVICGKYLPEGTTVSVPAWTMHRNPKFFSPGATEFRPERWLHPEKEEIFNTQAFFPFSYGPMNCVGKNVAMEEQRIVVSTLVRAFDMEVVSGGGFEDFEGLS
ncbi:cytochrome P450, partial [Atractiella rhizophila]